MKHLIPEGHIGLAPYGRGTSNCYSWNHAQKDISEAIDAVCESYSVNEDKVVLTGFSMGGYGVYRTYYENPDRFNALAIFSGHPNLANKWSGEEKSYPDFSKTEYLKKFADVSVFIFHGKEDRNCSFEKTQDVINKLKDVGANVRFVTEENKGHEAPESASIQEYLNWIKQVQGIKK